MIGCFCFVTGYVQVRKSLFEIRLSFLSWLRMVVFIDRYSSKCDALSLMSRDWFGKKGGLEATLGVLFWNLPRRTGRIFFPGLLLGFRSWLRKVAKKFDRFGKRAVWQQDKESICLSPPILSRSST